MAAPTWVSGQVLTASDVNTWFVPLAAVKTTTESVTSSTTLQNDDDLFVAVAANAQYHVSCVVWCDGASTGDIKLNWTGPAGFAITTVANGLASLGTTGTDDQVAAFDQSAAPIFGLAGGAGTVRPIQLTGTCITAGTSGTLRLQWAQGTSDATATRVLSGSHLVLQRIG